MPILVRYDGHRISVDEDRLERTQLPLQLFEEAWRRIETLQPGQALRVTVAMGRVVGFAPIVKAPQVRPDQLAVFARRKMSLHGRPSRVIRLEGAMPRAQHITIVASWKDDLWEARTAYSGYFVYPQPWDFKAIAQNGFTLAPVLSYWCRAAFLHRSRDFGNKVHEDTWAGLVETAARDALPETLNTIDYRRARRLWRYADADVEEL